MPRRGTTVASMEGMTGQRNAAIIGRRIVRWIRRHAMPGGRALQQRLDRIVAEAQAADAGIAIREPWLSINRTNSRLAHRVGVLALAVAALVILSIGGVSAATGSGPSSSAPPPQPPVASGVLTKGVHAIGQGMLKVDDDRKDVVARHAVNGAARWLPSGPRETTRRWPFRADPRRWPRLFANTTECTLNLDPITRRHWSQ